MKIKTILCTFILSFLLSGCSSPINENDSGDSGIVVHEHSWGKPTYKWSSDFSQCTAERVCLKDSNHKETETKESTYEILIDAYCETDGEGVYTVVFENSAFLPQSHSVVLPKINHTWGAPIYEWSDDNLKCTATCLCLNDNEHTLTETVFTTYTIYQKATELIDGIGRFTATFENNIFSVQTKDITIKYIEGQSPKLSADKKTIKYGIYPQSLVSDSNLIDKLNLIDKNESNGWYLHDNFYYAKLGEDWFKCEPIVWNVLNTSSNQYLVVSSVLLDVRTYNDYSNNNYYTSSIRKWLNDCFYKQAFNLDYDYVITTNVDNSASTTAMDSNKYESPNSDDKVFLLSYKDYINSDYGFDSNASRICKTTAWARANGAYYNSSDGNDLYNGWYWTRSPHYDWVYEVHCVLLNGQMHSLNISLDGRSVSDRPAITITIS